MESTSDFPGPRARELYLEASELPEDERAAWLERACAGDVELRAGVERLLELERRIPSEFLAGDAPAGRLEPGTSFAGFRVLSVLGEGGMGTVYAARQSLPARDIALKVVRADRWTSEARRRFEREVQALGSLQHPGIAQIHEAGTARRPGSTVDEPYLAMELVRGEPIVAFAERKALGHRARIELVARVADAVHHAHLRGVIHRDLKPDNVLVADDETTSPTGGRPSTGSPGESGPGRPKVLDFGIARLLGEDGPTQTRAGELVGTLAYMSPEQLSGDRSRVDERTDVYALGVLLYQLLSGRLPHDLAGLGLPEALRRLSEEPAAPLGRVAPEHQGDLATIAARALDPDPAQRYASAAALSEDLRRYLRGDPILARSQSTFYLLQRQLRRHRLAIGVLCGLALLVAGFTVVLDAKSRALSVLAVSRDEAFSRTLASLSEVSRLAGSLDAPWGASAAQRELMESVLAAHTELLKEHGNDPRALASTARLRYEVAVIHELLGEHQQAAEGLRETVAAYEALASPEAEQLLALTRLRLGGVEFGRDRLEAARSETATALEIFAKRGDRRNQALATSQLGKVALKARELERARDRSQEALALLDELEVGEAGVLERLEPLQTLAEATHWLEGPAAAVPICEQLIGALGAGSEDVAAVVHQNVGRIYFEAGRPEEGEQHLRLAVELGEERLAAAPEQDGTALQLANALNSLGALCGMTDRDEEAGLYLERALEVLEDVLEQQPDNPEIARYHAIAQANVGAAREASGRAEEGREVLERGCSTLARILEGRAGDLDVRLALAVGLNALAMLTGEQGQPERVCAILADFPPLANLDLAGRALSIYSATIGELRSDPERADLEDLVGCLVDGAANLLARCTEVGFADHDVIRTDGHFRALRAEPGFSAVLARY